VNAPRQNIEAAEKIVAQLTGQAMQLRAELARLRRELAREQHSSKPPHAAHVVEANEHLVLTLLHARSMAQSTEKSLSELFNASQRDELTGLANRMRMREWLQMAIAGAAARDSMLAVLCIGLDDFKSINDSLGHRVGELVLQVAAQRLQEVVRRTDAVSRNGAEEFLLLLTDVSDAANAKAIAHQIGAALIAPGQVGEHLLHLSASIGLAVYPQDGKDATLLIDRADAAMYRAKRMGAGRVVSHGDALFVDPVAPQPAAGSARPLRRPPLPNLADLREANERLVISATQAGERELHASEAHRRQVKLQAVVVHELRNPLVPIRMAAQLLKHAPNDERMISKLPDMIERQVSHMGRLIDDLMDSSRIGTGKFRLDYAGVALNEVIATAIEITTMAIDSRRQTLHLSMPSTLPTGYGDSARLIQVFSNVLDNASKYTAEAGEITVTVEHRDGALVTTIADNGIGIAAEMLPKIFDLFVQDTTALIRHNSGLGIGLAVVKELVHAHGGTVSVESEGRNQGSTFVVTLPLYEIPSRDGTLQSPQ
jgi:diguanylate cyclase (GGDEF)-like protein